MRRSFRLAAIAAMLAMVTACAGDDGNHLAAPSSPWGDFDEPGVRMVELELFDPSRDTPKSRGRPASEGRVLDTVVWYPAPEGEGADGQQGPYPLIVFSHGRGGGPDNVEDLADDWVRAGFVVAAPLFPLTRADRRGGPDANDVVNQPADVSFVITALTEELDNDSPLAGLIDAERIGVVGHSLGAITTLGVAANSCCLDDRIDAVVSMAGTALDFPDGEFELSDAPPMLLVHGTDDDLVDFDDAVTLYEHLDAPKGLLTIDDGNHDSWLSDGDDDHHDVVRVTTDFLQAYVAGDADAIDRLDQPELTSRAVSLEFQPGTESDDRGRTVTAEPTTGLVDGQRVTVTWRGFEPGGAINVVQCSRGGEPDGGDCALEAGYVRRPDPTGSGTVELPVIVGEVGDGSCDASATRCVILVNDSGLDDPDATIVIPLTFAP